MDVFYWKTSIIFKTPTKDLNYQGVKLATSKSETRVKPQDWLTETGRSSTTCVTYHKHCVLKFLLCLALPWLIVSAMMIILLFLRMEAFELGKLRGQGASGPKWGRGVVWGL